MSTRIDDFEPINLDGFDSEDLITLSHTYCDLGNYAFHKSVAMKYRADGDIQTASTHELICDKIYETLPEWAKW